MRLPTALVSALILILISIPSARAAAIDVNPGLKAVSFVSWEALSPKQRQLLGAFVTTIQDEAGWQSWAQSHDGWTAAFLSVSRALERTRLEIEPDHWITALELMDSIAEIKTDRVYFRRDMARFDRWRDDGGAFEIQREDGEEESGEMGFNGGVLFGGTVHEGYDLQGYTSSSRVPRLQFNIRVADSLTDVDLDGFAPRKWGWLPNPRHLSYENSDVKFWYPDFVRKFGAPGFEVRYADLELHPITGHFADKLVEETTGARGDVARVRQAMASRQVMFVQGFMNEWVPKMFADSTHAVRDELGGAEVTMVQPGSANPIWVNATYLEKKIRDTYAKNGRKPIVLVGQSKGGAEALMALLRFPQLVREGIVDRAVVIQGVILGTPLANLANTCNPGIPPGAGPPGQPPAGGNPNCMRNDGLESMRPDAAQAALRRALEPFTDDDRRVVDGKLFYIRSQIVNDEVTAIYKLPHLYLDTWGGLAGGFNGNDGQVPVYMQKLTGLGRDLGIVDADHADFITSASSRGADFRRAFTRAMFREIFE